MQTRCLVAALLGACLALPAAAQPQPTQPAQAQPTQAAQLNQGQGQGQGPAVVAYQPPAQGQSVNRLKKVFNRLVALTQRRDVRYRLGLKQDDNQVNAYALPDGQLVVLTGLLKAIPAGDDNALAFVLAHEISHVEKRHAEQLATNDGLTNGLLGMLVQNGDQLAQIGANVGSRLITSGYSRGMEAEADHAGLELMARAGYDPRGAITILKVFEKMEAQNGHARIFPDHPTATDRLKDTRAYLKETGRI